MLEPGKAQRGLAVTCGHDAKSVLLEGEREQTHDRRVVIGDENGMRTNLPRRLRGAGRWGRLGVPLDEPQFLPFSRGENIEAAPSSAGAPATQLDDAIDRFIVAKRIMVSEAPVAWRARRPRSRPPLGGRVAPARLLRILRNRVLSIVNHEVRVRKESDVTLVLLVPQWLNLGPCRRVRGMRLVIHRVYNRIAARLQTIAQRESRVIEILRGDAYLTNREFFLADIMKANCRCDCASVTGK